MAGAEPLTSSGPLVVGEFATPAAPYGLAFSHDGARLAIACGAWYGGGSVLVADGVNAATVLPGVVGDRNPTYASVAWAADDAALVACGWAASQRGGALHTYDPVAGLIGVAQIANPAATGVIIDDSGAAVIRLAKAASPSRIAGG